MAKQNNRRLAGYTKSALQSDWAWKKYYERSKLPVLVRLQMGDQSWFFDGGNSHISGTHLSPVICREKNDNQNTSVKRTVLLLGLSHR